MAGMTAHDDAMPDDLSDEDAHWLDEAFWDFDDEEDQWGPTSIGVEGTA